MSKGELVAAAAQPAVPAYYSAPQVPVFSFQDIQRMADSFAKSGMYGIRDSNQAMSLMFEAQSQGRHPASIMRDYHLMPSGQLAKKATAMQRDFQKFGGIIEWQELTDTRAAAYFSHPALCPKPLLIDWDLDRARRAGLAKDGQMYTKYARAMLRSRCVTEGIRTVAPDITEHMHSPEELATIEVLPEVVSIDAAVHSAVNAPEANEVEGYINSMDCSDMATLNDRFAAAWKSTRDPEVRARYKACFESMKLELAQQKPE
jgi:hypothetical protein